MRPIDADELLIDARLGDDEIPYISAAQIENAPTVKAEPIVRCKDCKWYEWGVTECHNPRYGDGWANYPSPSVYDDYFCADGERKE